MTVNFFFNVNINVVLLHIKYRNTVKQINLGVDLERKRKDENTILMKIPWGGIVACKDAEHGINSIPAWDC